MQASCYTRYLGNIKFFIDDNGIVQRWEGQPIPLGTSIIPGKLYDDSVFGDDFDDTCIF